MAKDKKPQTPANEHNVQQMPTTGEKQAPGAEAQQPGLQFITQFVKDYSFENPNAPESLVTGWPQPETDIKVQRHHTQVKDGLYDCTLQLTVTAKRKDDNRTCFILDVTYGALVMMQGIPAEHHHVLASVEVPKMIFPFVREIVASGTRAGGFPPLYLPPINFEMIYINEMKRAKEREQQQGGKAAV